MTELIRVGDKVHWRTTEGDYSGEVIKVYEEEVFHEYQGRHDSRIGSRNDRALLIRGDNGEEMLRLESEVKKVDK